MLLLKQKYIHDGSISFQSISCQCLYEINKQKSTFMCANNEWMIAYSRDPFH